MFVLLTSAGHFSTFMLLTCSFHACRYGAAVVHNSRLQASHPLQLFIADKLDCLVYNRDPPPPWMLQQLLHLDQPPPEQLQQVAEASATPSSAAVSASEGLSFGLRLSVVCPKAGLAFNMRSPASAPAPPPINVGVVRPTFVAVALHAIALDYSPSGEGTGAVAHDPVSAVAGLKTCSASIILILFRAVSDDNRCTLFQAALR